jgi:hypothetical protein
MTRTTLKSRPLSETHPELAAQADGWDPNEVAAGTHKRVPWVCAEGDRWMATVSNRTVHNSGCPFCSGLIARTGANDLATTHPDLAAQAVGWDPTIVKAGSGKKVRWRCINSHEWEATPNNRRNGSGCPVCSGRQVFLGYNDLASTRPDLAIEADGWDPELALDGSHKLVSWKCRDGHSWQARIYSRAQQGSGCPYCFGRKATPGKNDLATTHPDIAREAHGWDPTQVKSGSAKIVSWRCSLGHTWTTAILIRVRGYSCPTCDGKKVFKGFNDLGTVNPKLAAEAEGWDPSTVTATSILTRQWRCPKGHLWKTGISQRTQRGHSCPVCSNRRVLVGDNDLATTHPEFAAQADGWDPTKVTASSHKSVPWICAEGDRWIATINSRTTLNLGCAVCSGRRVRAGKNDLATTHPELASEAVDWDPTIMRPGSQKMVLWKCQEDHQWNARIASRALQGTGCPICAGKEVRAGIDDLATTHPDIAAEAVGWDPTIVKAGSGLNREWRCKKGHMWKASIDHRAIRNQGCPTCSNRRILVGENDLATTHAEIAAQADGWDPTTVTAGSGKKVKWICPDYGHRWSTSVLNRVIGETGCPSCAPYGFNPSKEAYLYFLEHDLWGLLQIGISHDLENRLQTHQSSGWEVLEIRGPMDGSLTYEWEQSIMRSLQKRSVKMGPKSAGEKFSGYTESWAKSDFPAKSLQELMNLVRDDEG